MLGPPTIGRAPVAPQIQASPPQKIAILCSDECNSHHLKERKGTGSLLGIGFGFNDDKTSTSIQLSCGPHKKSKYMGRVFVRNHADEPIPSYTLFYIRLGLPRPHGLPGGSLDLVSLHSNLGY